MAWRDLAYEALLAAKVCTAHPRASVSRSYYAAYSAVAQALVDSKGVRFKSEREGPSHEGLTELVKNHLIQVLNKDVIRQVCRVINRLYQARLDADYFPSRDVNEAIARQARLDAHFVYRELLRPEGA
jgi:uncharacterized protein (UPF0332 family)